MKLASMTNGKKKKKESDSSKTTKRGRKGVLSPKELKGLDEDTVLTYAPPS